MIKNRIIPAGPKPPKIVYCFVEIPKGGSNKYEYDHNLETFVLDRVLYGAMFYPTEYGYIPSTLSEDGDPLDIMVLSSFPTFPGCLIKASPIGALKMIDTGKKDYKIIAAASKDPRMGMIKSLKDLAPHFKTEIKNFWQRYAELQPNKKIEVACWCGKERAEEIISRSIERWQKSVK